MKKERHHRNVNQKIGNNYDIVKLRVRRFVAMLIDWYITNMFVSIPVTFYLRGNDYIRKNSFSLETYGMSTGMKLGLFAIVVGVIYYFIIPTFILKGQTLGKRICKIIVVKENGDSVTFGDMLVREILGATILEGGIVVTATYMRKILQLLGYTSIVTPLQYIAYTITILSIIYAYFHSHTQSFHDKLSKTVVIKKD